jgi:glucosamine-phosphate N-acetyltransferase
MKGKKNIMDSQNSLAKIRRLQLSDISPDSGFFDALQELDTNRQIDFDKAKDLFAELTKDSNHYIFVAEMDSGFAPIIGTATLRVEKQFLHNCSQYGVIDNVCVRKQFKGMSIGSQIISYICDFAKNDGCYKLILNCRDSVIPFYNKNGFSKVGNEMRRNLQNV